MKLLSIITTALSSLAIATATPSSAPNSVSRPPTFAPPATFKNANLVHIITLEKNYAKENINVLIENISSAPQDEYYLPFTADQMSRVGGVEVKDRKDASLGPFEVSAVEYDDKADTQYYRIRLPAPLGPGDKQTIGISFYYVKAYSPLPAAIEQSEKQYLTYSFSAFCPSAYTTTKQKTEVKLPSANVPDYTKIAEHPQKEGAKLTYGPFGEQAAGASAPAQVRFEFTKPVLHVASLERDVEVSHWGGNVAFEERYDLYHRGANLSSEFSRIQWQRTQRTRAANYALTEMRFPLRAGSSELYYTDAIGNVSTSDVFATKREVLLATRPRYPVFGGWKFPFVIGWNIDAGVFLRRSQSGGYVLNVPFLEGPKQPEGVEYAEVTVQVLLPEGAENVKYHADIPASSIVESSVGLKRTFLDTLGRTSVTIKAKNLVDDFRDRELVITYDYPLSATLRKPLVIFGSTLAVFVAWWIIGGLEVGFSSTK
ncbi:probable oligosaccharyltransferase alpha subunit [Cephalotrichum gorgonifer]|uniref:Dolichyl-diphosphooligosaccharide--protein glycosyltransferase subunit 1 n=1 Tax=Cephalotrichum gorgonifer TaxID=2041049 RepID=A0AAE8MUG0_9PEZI|nr:probable oligosaccharyltransferase alpha subunit [Cephalotrichum gorgonifer]